MSVADWIRARLRGRRAEPSEANDDTPVLREDTLELLFELSRGTTDLQMESGVVHDKKATTLAGAASVVLGFVALAPEQCRELTLAAFVAYGLVLTATLYCIWPRSFAVIRHPDVLWRDFWDATPREIKHAVVVRTADDYTANKKILRRKVVALFVVLAATAVEAVLVGLQVVVV